MTSEGFDELLERLAASLKAGDTNRGTTEQLKAIADALTTEETRDALHERKTLEIVANLFKTADDDAAKTQLCRLIGNACFNHTSNRATCIERNLHKQLLAILANNEPPRNSILKRAATGALLNLIMDSESSQKAIIRENGIQIISEALSTPLYQVGRWKKGDPNASVASFTTLWLLNILEELRLDKSNTAEFRKQHAYNLPLAALIANADFDQHESENKVIGTEAETLHENDRSIMLQASALLEGLALDVDHVRIDLAKQAALDESQSLVAKLMDFLEFADLPLDWDDAEKDFAMIKAAVGKTLTAASSEDDMMEICMAAEYKERPHWTTKRLIEWTKGQRADLLICSSIMLANLARNDAHALVFVQKYKIAPIIETILVQRTATDRPSSGRPGENTQVLHGVISLLKHLAIPARNKPFIASPALFHASVSCLSSSYDLAHPLQAAAIGLVKSFVTNNFDNAVLFLVQDGALSAVISLAERSDETRIKSEAERAVSVLLRSAWSAPNAQKNGQTNDQQSEAAQNVVIAQSKRIANLLVALIQASNKWPLLLNEAIVALTLLLTTGDTAAIAVASALCQPCRWSKSPKDSEEASVDDGASKETKLSIANGNDTSEMPDLAQLSLTKGDDAQSTLAYALIARLSQKDAINGLPALPDEIKTNILAFSGVLLNFLPPQSQEMRDLCATLQPPLSLLSAHSRLPPNLQARADQLADLLTKCSASAQE